MTASYTELHYQLSVTQPELHIFTIELCIPKTPQRQLTLSLPAWIPGSYMVRDFAKSIIELSAYDVNGNIIATQKTDKQNWIVSANGQGCKVIYHVYANDLSIRSAFINHEYAFINGTSAFLKVDGLENSPCTLSINAPVDTNWEIETSMPKSDRQIGTYIAKNYDDLIDHPLFIGNAINYSFWVDGVEFVLLFSGDTPVDVARIAQDLIPICQHHLDLFGKPYPISRYVFMTLLSDAGYGGLEHMSSTALLYPRYDLPLLGEKGDKSDGYITFLSLCSHELFHTWHVKRIKPRVMVSPDLSKETYTNQLWIYEGFTSFYDDATLARAGSITPEQYLDIVAKNITRLVQNSGRKKQSIAESSFDAWTKFYKQDASATNNIVSYYTKGGIAALGLDLLIREKSNGTYSLDNLMQALWEQYGVTQKGTPDDVIQTVCSDSFNLDVNDYLNDVVYGTKDIDLDKWLDSIGIKLHYRALTSAVDKGGITSAPAIKNQLGAAVKSANIGLTVTQVFEGLAAAKAGIYVGDILIAFNSTVVTLSRYQRLLDASTGDSIEVSVIRDGKLLTLALPLIEARKDACYFTIEDKEKLNTWLGR